jgi:predicted transport protein
MALFKINDRKVVKIQGINLAKEKAIQTIFEENLEIIINVQFLSTEYSTSFGGRIDTLGIDKNGSPTIIEYKLTKDDNVINQGLSYLKWLLDHKADFQALCKKHDIPNENIKSINWDSPRVICVAESYNKFDLDTAEILPIKIELLKYKVYENGLLYVEQETQTPVKISTSKIYKKAQKTDKPQRDLQKSYTLEEHLSGVSPEIKDLFMKLREKILSLDSSIKEDPQKHYIAYKLTTNFTDIVIKKKGLIVFLNVPSGKLTDPYGMARDTETPKHIGHWGNGDYDIRFNKLADINKVFELINKSYTYNK